jgi:hypothetical protein
METVKVPAVISYLRVPVFHTDSAYLDNLNVTVFDCPAYK